MYDDNASPVDLQQIQGMLEIQRAELIRRITDHATVASASPGTSSDRSTMAQQVISRESNLKDLARAQQLLKSVEGALERLDEGTYGICVHCGNTIRAGRLEALPYSALCLRCKETFERSPVGL